MTTLRTAAQQALGILCSEFTTVDGEFCRWCDGRLNAKHNCALEQTITALRAALAQQDEPCLNCASLEAQNTELDRKLAELEQAYEAGYKAGEANEREECAKACEHQPHWVACAAAIRARGNT